MLEAPNPRSHLTRFAGPSQLLRCQVSPAPGAAVVAPEGEMDLSNAHEIDAELQALRSVGFDHLVVDLRKLEFLDSTGLRLLVKWHRLAGDGGPRLSIVQGRPHVQRVLEIAGLDDLLHVVDAAEVAA